MNCLIQCLDFQQDCTVLNLQYVIVLVVLSKMNNTLYHNILSVCRKMFQKELNRVPGKSRCMACLIFFLFFFFGLPLEVAREGGNQNTAKDTLLDKRYSVTNLVNINNSYFFSSALSCQ